MCGLCLYTLTEETSVLLTGPSFDMGGLPSCQLLLLVHSVGPPFAANVSSDMCCYPRSMAILCKTRHATKKALLF